ncbi:MAG: 3-oxoacyl-ACP reductase FabG [Syntrophobacteraceae bacterium]|nr:3-oxoacyl-ACP reductase FabG [Syntrophobacteraceae bacterium]
MRLSGKVAIVTGAAQGLGREFCLGLAREGAGVMAVTRKDMDNLEQTVKMVRSLGGEAEMIRADVSSEADAQNMVKETIDRFGRVDVLINNAAIYAGIKRKPFYEIDLAEFDLVMNVNVKGAFIATRSVFPFMKEQGYGKIVNLASEVFFTGSNGFAHYVASKGGIIGLTRALAIELGPHQICINCIAPGFTDTEASRGIADVGKYDVSRTPLKRMEKPEDLVGAALFLASPDSDFITGQTLLIDGGRAMH